MKLFKFLALIALFTALGPSSLQAALVPGSSLVSPAADPGQMTLQINKTTGEASFVMRPGESLVINGFALAVLDSAGNPIPTWFVGNLNLSGIAALGVTPSSDATNISALAVPGQGSTVGDVPISLGNIYDPVAGANFQASDFYFEYTVVGVNGTTFGAVDFVGAVAIPEPSSLALLSVSGLLISFARRRRA